MIFINIEEVGDLQAMVDSGAGCTIIREDLVAHLKPFRKEGSGYLIAFHGVRVPTLGVVTLTISYLGTLVVLKSVNVVAESMHPCILGHDWMEPINAFTGFQDGKATVILMPPTPTTFTPDTVINMASTDSSSVRTAEYPFEREEREEADGSITVHQANGPEGHVRFVDEPTVHIYQEDSYIGAIQIEEPTPPRFSSRVRASQSNIVHPETLGYILIDLPANAGDCWIVDRAGSSNPHTQWIIPNCVIMTGELGTHVPIINLGTKPIMWCVGDTVASLEPLEGDPILMDSLPNGFFGFQEHPTELPTNLNFGDELNCHEREELLRVLKKNLACFSPGKIENVYIDACHRIDTGYNRPVSTAPRRVAPGERRIIAEQVSKLLQDDVIEPSSSPWASAVVLAKKKDGSPRFCVDYRSLNAVTKKDVYPLPRIDDLLQRLSGAAVFSSLDLKDGFWQVPVHHEDREKTAFVTPEGLFQFKYMAFGLSNAPATFMRLIDRVLVGLKWTHCLAYLDDVLVFGSDFSEHLLRLDLVLQALAKAGLKLRPDKCYFGVHRVMYLGHEVDRNGIRPDPDKLAALRQFPTPRDVKGLRSYLGLASFYRRFVLGFAKIAAPLHKLLKQNEAWSWGPEQENAFTALKEALLKAPTLVHDNETDRLILRTDASKTGLGAVLHVIRDGFELPVTFISRRTTTTEANYHSNELECLALVWALGKLRHYLYGRPFSVLTDNSALSWLQSKKDVGGKLGRWILALQEFDFDIRHLKGAHNVVADALSRYPVGAPEDTDPMEKMVCCMISKPYSHNDVAVLQQGDPSIKPILLKTRDGCPVTSKDFTIHRNALYKRVDNSRSGKALVIPSFLRRDVLRALHDDPTGGHMGEEKTYYRVRQRYWWPGMSRSVKSYVSSCRTCQVNKPVGGTPVGKLMPIPPPAAPFDTIGADHLGPFKETKRGNRHILVLVDYLTKWVIAVPVKDTTSAGVMDVLRDHVFSQHGIVSRIITDQGTAFTSESLATFVARLGVRMIFASGERPQTNGLTERMNRTLVSVLKTYVNFEHDDWDDHLPWAVLAINSTRHAVTKRSPFELVYGRVANLPIDSVLPCALMTPQSPVTFRSRIRRWRKEARELIINNQRQVKARFDARHKLSRPYEKGDLVLVSRKVQSKGKTKKFLHRFIGPFQIAKQKCENTYLVEDIPALQKRRIQRRFNAHVAQLRLFKTPTETEWLPEDLLDEDSDEDPTDDPGTGAPQDAPQPTTAADQQPINQETNRPYVTRSGRTVKPNSRPLFR